VQKVRVGLVGCGARSMGHLDAVDACDGLEMIGCADPAEPGRARYRERYPESPLYDSIDELLAQGPDVVAICTREHPRCKLCMAAVEAGVRAIVLEKPMARTVDEARRMVAAAKEKGVRLVVSHQCRFDDEFEVVRDAVRSGEIGQPYYLRGSCYGQLMEQGPHIIDMILWYLEDAEVDWVMASVADIEEGRETVHPAPAFVVGYIAFKNGARAVVECGRRFQKALSVPEDVTWLQKRVQVIGTEGIADAVVNHYGRVLNASGGWHVLYEGAGGWENSTKRFYAELHDVLVNGGQHRNHADTSLLGFEIVHAMFQSVIARDRVSLPIPEGGEPLEEIMGTA